MAINLKLYNRIIKLTLYRQDKPEIILPCPPKGRKPKIEISGNILPSMDIPAFNLTIKNLYLEIRGDLFTKVKVEAGYEGATAPIEGSINTIYQESPGPEGTTYIQCWEGQMASWLDTCINVEYPAGTTLSLIIAEIGNKLKTKGSYTGAKHASTLRLKDKFVHNGTVRDAISKLKTLFSDDYLVIYMRNDILTAICLTQGDYVNVHTLDHMSAPPQFNNGDKEGTYNLTITAPWDPTLQPGDMLIVPSPAYQKYGEIVGTKTGTQKIQVQNIAFHFGTTGGTNSMTVQGYLINE